MQTSLILPDVWQQYFTGQMRSNGLDYWAIVFAAYEQGDLFLSLANPLTDQHNELFVTEVPLQDAQTFISHYRQRFMAQLPLRFGFYRPEVDQVLTEYPDWPTFYQAWVGDDPTRLQANIPLLFDFPSPREYRAMRLKAADYAGYRRLLVVIYQYRKQRFQKIFIQNIDDTVYQHIIQHMQPAFAAVLPAQFEFEVA